MVVQMALVISAALRGSRAFAAAKGGLNGVANAAKTVSAELGALAGLQIGSFLASAAQSFMTFDDNMQAVKAATDATNSAFTDLTETALELAGSVGRFKPQELAEGMRFLAFAGFETAEILSTIGSAAQLATIAFIGVGEAARTMASILRSFNIDAEDSDRVVDVLGKTFASANVEMGELANTVKLIAPIANQLGFQIEEVSAAIAVLGDAGFRGSIAGTALRNVFLRLSAPFGKAADKIFELGLDLFEMKEVTEEVNDEFFSFMNDSLGPGIKTFDEAREGISQFAEATAELQKTTDASSLQLKQLNLDLRIFKFKSAF